MSKVYISSRSKLIALAAKSSLEDAGHEVVSTWHKGDFKRTAQRDVLEMRRSAASNVDLIAEADALFLVVPLDPSPGGALFEAGVAIGLEVPVIAVGLRDDGTRGNNMLYHPDVHQFSDIKEGVTELQGVVDVHNERFIDDDDIDDMDDDEDLDDDDDIEDVDVDESGSVITTADTSFGYFGVTLDSYPVCGDGSETGLQVD